MKYVLTLIILCSAFAAYSIFNSVLAGFIGFCLGCYLTVKFPDGFSREPEFDETEEIRPRKENQAVFIQTAFTLMGRIAIENGNVSDAEMAQAENLMDDLNLDSIKRQNAIQYFQNGTNPTFHFDHLVQKFVDFKASTEQKEKLVSYLFRVAAADGKISQDEMNLIRTLSKKLGYHEQQLKKLIEFFLLQKQSSYQYQGKKSYRTVDAKAYQLLGIRQDSNNQEIKSAYRRLIREYHPDKLIGQGLSELMIEEATIKSQQIQAAYDTIKQSRGI